VRIAGTNTIAELTDGGGSNNGSFGTATTYGLAGSRQFIVKDDDSFNTSNTDIDTWYARVDTVGMSIDLAIDNTDASRELIFKSGIQFGVQTVSQDSTDGRIPSGIRWTGLLKLPE
jgi:hypothetical protein